MEMAKNHRKNKMAGENAEIRRGPLAGSEECLKKGVEGKENSRKKGGPCQGRAEVKVESRLVQAKRREVRKVATTVKRLKKNVDEPAASFTNEPKEGAGGTEAAGNAWSAHCAAARNCINIRPHKRNGAPGSATSTRNLNGKSFSGNQFRAPAANPL